MSDDDIDMELFVILHTTTSLLSLMGSSLLICTILQSERKLSVPYRRIVFGISVFDIFQSAGAAAGIVSVPKGLGPWSIGNTTTCNIQGFFFVVGVGTVPLYLSSLCIYYFCIVRLNMTAQVFRRIEPFLHGIPICYGLSIGIYALVNQYINSWIGGCSLTAAPYLCEHDPDTECVRGEGASMFESIFIGVIQILALVIICSSMTAIVCSAKKIQKRNRRYSIPRSSISTEQVTRRNSIARLSSVVLSLKSDDTTGSPESPAVLRQQRRQLELDVSKTREVTKQALLYVGSFLLAYGWQLIREIHYVISNGSINLPLVFLHCFFFPLQGFINVFIYCRPHVVSLRKRYPGEYSWFRAFRVVLKSGGDSCRVTVAAEREQHRRKRGARDLLVDDEFTTEDTPNHESARDVVIPVAAPEEHPVTTTTETDASVEEQTVENTFATQGPALIENESVESQV